MLYIASALESSAVTHSISVPSFTSSAYEPESTSLVIAKGKIIEVWDATPEGLVKVAEVDVWGVVVGLCWVGNVKAGQQPHIVVLTDHPLTRLLLYSFVQPQPPSASGKLALTAHHWIDRQSRTAEFLTTLISDPISGLVIASLYAGLLTVVEVATKRPGEGDDADADMDVDKEKDRKKITPSKRNGKGKRKESLVAEEQGDGGVAEEEAGGWGPMTFKSKNDINIREHNLLSLAILPQTPSEGSSSSTLRRPLIAFLYLTPDYDILLLARTYDRATLSFKDRTSTIDVRSPPLQSIGREMHSPGSYNMSGDFSVPAAKQLLALPQENGVLVVGDEYSASYTLAKTRNRSTSGSVAGASRRESLSMNMSTSAGITGRTSPEGKRRKASTGGSFVPGASRDQGGTGSSTVKEETKDAYTWRRGTRFRQGFGEVMAMAATWISGTASALFLGDASGRLTMATYERGSTSSAVVLPLGTISPASALVYLDDGYLFVSSTCGDSHLIHIRSRSIAPVPSPSLCLSPQHILDPNAMEVDELDTTSPNFDIVDTWTNIAPVRDLCVVKQEGSDDSQIVAASGLAPSGSLRLIKSGVGIEELARVEGIVGVTAMFPTGSTEAGEADTAAFISTAESTRYLRIHGGSDEDFSVSEAMSDQSFAFIADEATLAAGNLADGSVVQITKSKVVILAPLDQGIKQTWTSDRDVVHACLIPGHAVIALQGGVVKLLQLSLDRITFIAATLSEGSEIASLDAILGPGGSLAGLVAIGQWGDNRIQFLSMPLLNTLQGTISERTLPTSLRFRPTARGVSLSVGLADGSLATHTLDDLGTTSGSVVASQRKDMSLGRSPVLLAPRRTVQGEDSLIISTSDRTSIVFAEQGRLSHSALGSRDISTAGLLNTNAFGDVLAIAKPNGISLVRITSLKNLHIRKVDLGADAPVGVAHDARSATYAVAVNLCRLDHETGEEHRSSGLRLYDDASLLAVSEVVMDRGEEIVTLAQVSLDARPYFAVTTVFPDRLNDAGSASVGSVKIYTADPASAAGGLPSLVHVTGTVLGGTVYDVKAIWGYLAVAVDHRVVLYELDTTDTSAVLRQVSEWGNAMFASCLTVQTYEDSATGTVKERLHVGDGMRSVFSVELSSDNKMVDVGRDMRPHWIVSMAELKADRGAVVLADTSYNVLTIKHENNRMENAAALALHEVVSKFAPGSIVPANDASVKPELVFATSSGRLGVIADLGSTESKLLGDLQRNMEDLVEGPGLAWRRYREVHTEGTAKPRQTVGFVDGDFVKHFLRATGSVDSILRGQNDFTRLTREDGKIASRDDVVKVLEAVGSLH